jgi:hypothetical protein
MRGVNTQKNIAENRSSLTAAFLLIFIISLFFSYWFAQKQLQFISLESLDSNFPIKYFVITMLRGMLTLLISYMFSFLILAVMTGNKINGLYIACTFFPFLLLYKDLSLSDVVVSVVLLQVALLFCLLKKADFRGLTEKYFVDFCVLALIILLHLFLSTGFSPLYWDTSWHTSIGGEEISAVSPLFKEYVLAKQFVFSPLDYSSWLVLPNPPINLASPLLAFLTVLFNLPSIDVIAFHKVVLGIYFSLIVIGSFGFYLFIRYAAKQATLFAIFGACLFFFSCEPFMSRMIYADGVIFLSAYACFPYALVLITFAFQKENYLLAAAAAVAINAQFFLVTPHPEGVIYSFLFYGIFAVGLFLFSPLKWQKRFMLLFITFGSLVLLSAFSLWPIMLDQVLGNMHTFSHTADIEATDYNYFKTYVKILTVSAFVSFCLLRRSYNLTPAYLATLLLSFSLLAIMLLTTSIKFNTWLSTFLHVGLHLWFVWRIGMYFSLSVFIIAIYALNALAQAITSLMSGNLSYWKDCRNDA